MRFPTGGGHYAQDSKALRAAHPERKPLCCLLSRSIPLCQVTSSSVSLLSARRPSPLSIAYILARRRRLQFLLSASEPTPLLPTQRSRAANGPDALNRSPLSCPDPRVDLSFLCPASQLPASQRHVKHHLRGMGSVYGAWPPLRDCPALAPVLQVQALEFNVEGQRFRPCHRPTHAPASPCHCDM